MSVILIKLGLSAALALGTAIFLLTAHERLAKSPAQFGNGARRMAFLYVCSVACPIALGIGWLMWERL